MLDNLVKGKFEGYFCVVKENMAVPVAIFLSKTDAISWIKTNLHQLKGLKVEFHPTSPEFSQALMQYLGFLARPQHNRIQRIGQITKDVRIVPIQQDGQ